MLTFFQAIVLGSVQGFTELFPISSLGHSILIPHLLGWDLDQSSPYFLPFLVATHLATAVVLIFFFFGDWKRIVIGMWSSLRVRTINSGDSYAKLGWLLVVATLPAGILGLLFEKDLQQLFSQPKPVALFLLLNGVLLWGIEFVYRKRVAAPTTQPIDVRIAALSWRHAFGVGCMQCLALLPGFSRTGASIGGGLFAGLSHEAAARFSFLLATPIILAAAVLELPTLFIGTPSAVFLPALTGAFFAAAAAYISVRFLSTYFKTKTLVPFALYCVAAGALFYFL
jgi:undecaprenyl-diphosphatase